MPLQPAENIHRLRRFSQIDRGRVVIICENLSNLWISIFSGRGVAVLPRFERVQSWAYVISVAVLAAVGSLTQPIVAAETPAPERLRLIVETDAGGDPDDEQSLVRFLLYAAEWDVEGIIANRPVT